MIRKKTTIRATIDDCIIKKNNGYEINTRLVLTDNIPYRLVLILEDYDFEEIDGTVFIDEVYFLELFHYDEDHDEEIATILFLDEYITKKDGVIWSRFEELIEQKEYKIYDTDFEILGD